MKISLGGGVYLEPDEGPRDTPHHKLISRMIPIAGTLSGHWLELECGHRVQAFGKLEHANGVVLCTQCRDGAA